MALRTTYQVNVQPNISINAQQITGNQPNTAQLLGIGGGGGGGGGGNFQQNNAAMQQNMSALARQSAAIALTTNLTVQNLRQASQQTRNFSLGLQQVAHHFRIISRFGKGLAEIGLGGGASLLGLDLLAGAVSSRRRSALGLGVGYGQLNSFGLNFDRFVNTKSLLGNVSGSLYNATSPGYTGLLASGISPQFLNSHNAADVSVELLKHLPDLMKNTPRNLVGARLQSLGLDNLISPEDTVRYLNASPAERSAQQNAYNRDRGSLSLTSGQQLQWQNFQNQLERAGLQIENTLVVGLSGLTGPIGKLSDSFEKAISAFLKSDTVKDAIDTVAKGLDWFASYINSDKFKSDFQALVENLQAFGGAIVNILKAIGLVPKVPGAPNPNSLSGDSTSDPGQQKFNTIMNGLIGNDIPGRVVISGRGVNSRLVDNANIRGIRNLNPTNIAYGDWAKNHGSIGGSGMDNGHLVAAFGDMQTGIYAAEVLALQKYRKGMLSPDQFVAGPGGWNPGNTQEAAGVARTLGIGSGDDLQLNNPTQLKSFMRALVQQEVGPNGASYLRQNYPRLDIYDNTGGNVNITTNQAASPGAPPATGH